MNRFAELSELDHIFDELEIKNVHTKWLFCKIFKDKNIYEKISEQNMKLFVKRFNYLYDCILRFKFFRKFNFEIIEKWLQNKVDLLVDLQNS